MRRHLYDNLLWKKTVRHGAGPLPSKVLRSRPGVLALLNPVDVGNVEERGVVLEGGEDRLAEERGQGRRSRRGWRLDADGEQRAFLAEGDEVPGEPSLSHAAPGSHRQEELGYLAVFADALPARVPDGDGTTFISGQETIRET